LQVIKEKAKKEFLNTRYDQPYQQALYNLSVLLELQRWHINDYIAVIDGLQPSDLQACSLHLLPTCLGFRP
jgi:insulysin